MVLASNGINLDTYGIRNYGKKGETSDLEIFTNKIIDLNFANSVFVDCSASKM